MPEQDQTLRPATTNLLLVAGEFMLLVALGLIPVMAVYADVVVLGNEVGEASVTEITQSVLLLATIAIFARGAWRLPHHRGLLILGAGFFGCAFVRESDSLLDVVWH